MQGNAPTALPKYWSDVEQTESHRAQLDLVAPGSRVLEIGAAGGHMTQALSKHGCKVTAVERDPALAESAQRFCARLVLADVESPDFETQLEDEQFDVVLLGDVLEHLREPEDLLKRLRPHLSPHGYLVICLPNIAHGAVCLALLDGRFDYRPAGLLDQTHLKFFTLASLSSMIDAAGYTISDLRRIRHSFFNTEIPVDPSTVPMHALRLLIRSPEAMTYQFVFRAYPKDRHHEPATTPPPPPDAASLRSELSRLYDQMGSDALFNSPFDIRRARRLRYRAFVLQPSVGRLRRLMFAFLPPRLLHALARIYDSSRRRRDGR